MEGLSHIIIYQPRHLLLICSGMRLVQVLLIQKLDCHDTGPVVFVMKGVRKFFSHIGKCEGKRNV